MKKKLIIISIIVGVLLILSAVLVNIYKRKVEQRNHEITLALQSINAERVLRDIAATGEVVIQDDQVVINDLEVRDIDLLLRVNYYNYNAGPSSALTMEQVKEQFNIYIVNYEYVEGSTDELEHFCSYIENEEIAVTGACYEYDHIYLVYVYLVLTGMGTDFEAATREQLEEACHIALSAQTRQEIEDQFDYYAAESIIENIAATGEVVVQDGEAIITSLEFNDNELLLRINYYNAETDSTLTMEQVKEQFNIYVADYEYVEGSTDELESFCAFIKKKQINLTGYITGACDEYESYQDDVKLTLKGMGNNFTTATREQLEEACRIVLEN